MTDQFSPYHLYLSKSSDLRSKIKTSILDIFSNLDQFNPDELHGYIDQIQELPLFTEYPRQYQYGIIDFFLIHFISDRSFGDVINSLFKVYRDYIVLHELAALSWGDELIPKEMVFAEISKRSLSEKHLYHILNEMSVTFPAATYKFAKDLVDQSELATSYLHKLEKKMLQDRTKGKVLAKDAIPKLSRQEIFELIN